MLYNPNNGIGHFINQANQVTGSLFLTLLFITLIILIICILTRLPLEFSIIFILPLHFVILAYVGGWMAVAGSFLIYAGILIAKNFFIT